MGKYLIIMIFMILGTIKSRAQNKRPSDFLPQGYLLFEEYYGDLNKDGKQDCVLIIKKIDHDNIVVDRFDKKVDRNRRGIMVLFKKNKGYKIAEVNYDCFSSENEDGGVYFPPELWVEVENGNLVVHYGHGRYGFWRYIFEFQDSNFKLIGYFSSNNYGPTVNRETSINFLTKEKLIKENINENDDEGDEIFKETLEEIEIEKLLKLSEVRDFDELDMYSY